MRAREFISEGSSTTLEKMYGGDYPDRDEIFWDYVTRGDLDRDLTIGTMPAYMLRILLQSQYRVEHLDEILDMMDEDQVAVLRRYMSDPDLSSKIILISDSRVIDGNHRALAAAIGGVPIKYVDLAELDEGDLNEISTATMVNYVPKAGATLKDLSPEKEARRRDSMTTAFNKIIKRPDGGKEIARYRAEKDREQGVAEGFSGDNEYHGMIMSIVEGEDGFKLTATSPKGTKLGFVEFSYDTDGTIKAEELEVYEKFRGQGIAKTMYDYVKEQGFTIARSSEQTPDGAAFWDKNRPNKKVWEQSVAEGTGNISWQRYEHESEFVKQIPREYQDPVDSGDGTKGEFYDKNDQQIGVFVRDDFREYDGPGQGAYWGPKTSVSEGRRKKKRKSAKSVRGYFFPGYAYYGIGNSGEEGGDGGGGESINRKIGEDAVDEMALASYKTMGDFTKPGPFTGPDKKLVPHPKNIEKATKFFEQTPYDFRLFFSNVPGTGKYSEYGPMTPENIKTIFKDQGEEILKDSGDAITVVFVGNRGDRKVMLTPWMMAHRFGHAIQAGARKNRGWHVWTEAENHFFNSVNSLLEEHYGKIPQSKPQGRNILYQLEPEYNALFNAIGTQRSSRSGEIRRPYEFLYEIFAQYLGTGKITFNPLPANLGYGRKVFGNPTKYMNIKSEYRDEADRKQVADTLAYDMELMFSDVLSSSVGQIFVM